MPALASCPRPRPRRLLRATRPLEQVDHAGVVKDLDTAGRPAAEHAPIPMPHQYTISPPTPRPLSTSRCVSSIAGRRAAPRLPAGSAATVREFSRHPAVARPGRPRRGPAQAKQEHGVEPPAASPADR